jgi:uncharacterized protein
MMLLRSIPLLQCTRPIVAASRGPGRNEPCACGSGKKFKKCCMGRNGEIEDEQPAEGSPKAA